MYLFHPRAHRNLLTLYRHQNRRRLYCDLSLAGGGLLGRFPTIIRYKRVHRLQSQQWYDFEDFSIRKDIGFTKTTDIVVTSSPSQSMKRGSQMGIEEILKF